MGDAPNLTVYGVGTPRTFRVYWALHELGLNYQRERIVTRTSDMESEAFLQISPGKKIPALKHDDFVIIESAAITRYLYDAFSENSLSLTEAATVNRWISFALMEIDATAFYVVRKHEGLPEIYGAAPVAVDAAYAYAERQFSVVDGMLADGRDYVLGDRFSEADIHLGSCTLWATMIDFALPGKVQAYHERLSARSAQRAALQANIP